MKQGWEIKKLGEVCSLIADGDWIESRHQSEDGIRLIQTGNVGNGVFKAKDDKPHYISESTFVELGCTEIFAGDCLVSRLPDPVGRACIIPETNCRMITAVDCSIIRFNSDIVSKFFIYYTQCEKYRRDIDNNTTGTTRKRISRKNLESICIPIPPREEQERIVAELDCLSGVIEKKREQLKGLDALAQSIFYQMFGDPITNEKGWDVKKLSDAVSDDCPISYGIVQPMEDVEGGVPIVRPIDLVDTFVRKDNLKRTSAEISNAYKRTILRGDEILMCVRGTTGVVSMASDELKGCNTTRGIVPLFFDSINRWFVYYLIKQQSMQCLIADNTYGIALKQINIKELRLLPIIAPPLTLQQEFAEKIEAIEKQKELIKQSITQTEELFNSRMDYYFN